MKRHIIFILFILAMCLPNIYAQLGIKAGVNLANEIKSFKKADIVEGFSKENLTGYQIGLICEMFRKKSALGGDIGTFISQKGYTIIDNISLENSYKEYNYFEIPLNLRYRFSTKIIGAYATCGLYAGYILSGKSGILTESIVQNISFSNKEERYDYGYNLGVGIEFFKKIQLGLSWSQGLKNVITTFRNDESLALQNDIRVFNMNLVYLFSKK